MGVQGPGRWVFSEKQRIGKGLQQKGGFLFDQVFNFWKRVPGRYKMVSGLQADISGVPWTKLICGSRTDSAAQTQRWVCRPLGTNFSLLAVPHKTLGPRGIPIAPRRGSVVIPIGTPWRVLLDQGRHTVEVTPSAFAANRHGSRSVDGHTEMSKKYYGMFQGLTMSPQRGASQAPMCP